MTILYCEEDSEHNVPILITDLDENKILIEIRGYHQGERRGCLWNIITWNQAKRLRDALSVWLFDHPRRDE